MFAIFKQNYLPNYSFCLKNILKYRENFFYSNIRIILPSYCLSDIAILSFAYNFFYFIFLIEILFRKYFLSYWFDFFTLLLNLHLFKQLITNYMYIK